MRRLALVLFLAFSSLAPAKHDWSHIEYGAANAVSGSTRPSPYASKAERNRRYKHLYDQLDALVTRNGPFSTGTFYVNDLDPEETGRAANLLYLRAKEKGFNVRVISLPGNYFQMDLPITDTAALRNPEGDFFSTPKIHLDLQRLGDHTREGLEFTTSVRAGELFGFRHLGEGPAYIDPVGRQVNRQSQRYQVPSRTQHKLPGPGGNFGNICPVITSRLAAPIQPR